MLQDIIGDCDLVLVMSVNPGFGGQRFIPRSIEKLSEARRLINARNPRCLLEVDGGVGTENIRAVVDAGANTIVMGSSIFGTTDPAATVRVMRRLAGE
jgi:ribulose-phosphate 3-epimerase